MLRALAVSAVLVIGACKDQAATSAGGSSPAATPAEPAGDGDAPTLAEGRAGESEGKAVEPQGQPSEPGGLASAVKDVLADVEPSKATLLIPEGATVVVGLDVSVFVSHPLFGTLERQLGRRQREQLEAATRCGVGPDKWRTFVIGIDLERRDMAMVTEAEGLGTKAKLQCLVREIGTFTLSADGKTMSDHTGGGIVIDDDAVAFATPAWMTPLADRIEGRGTAAVEGSLRAAWSRADPAAPLWFAGLVPARERQKVRAILGAEPSSVAGTVRVSESTQTLRVTLDVADPQTAQQQLQNQWNALEGFATSGGLPQAIADSVTIGEASGAVSVELRASNTDIETILTKIAVSRGY